MLLTAQQAFRALVLTEQQVSREWVLTVQKVFQALVPTPQWSSRSTSPVACRALRFIGAEASTVPQFFRAVVLTVELSPRYSSSLRQWSSRLSYLQGTAVLQSSGPHSAVVSTLQQFFRVVLTKEWFFRVGGLHSAVVSKVQRLFGTLVLTVQWLPNHCSFFWNGAKVPRAPSGTGPR